METTGTKRGATHDMTMYLLVVPISDDLVEVHVVGAAGAQLADMVDEVRMACMGAIDRVLGPNGDSDDNVEIAMGAVDCVGHHPDAPTAVRVSFEFPGGEASRYIIKSLRRDFGAAFAGRVLLGVRQ